MKYLPIVILGLILTCFSCSNDTENTVILEEKTIKSTEKEILDSRIISNIPNVKNTEMDKMYMTSYLIGLVLLEDAAAREYFYRITKAKTLKFSLRSLLNNTGNPFELAFKKKYAIYNWSKTAKGDPTPPISTALPDPLDKGYLVLTIDYPTYLFQISNTYNWSVCIPNKHSLHKYPDFNAYLNNEKQLINLWNLNGKLYNDGLIMSQSFKSFIPSRFNYSSALNNTLIINLTKPTLTRF